MAHVPCARVFLRVEVSSLQDPFTKCNPICVVHHLTALSDGSGTWVEVGRTEVVWNVVSPEFARRIPCDYFFEQRQKLRFEIYDVDSDTDQHGLSDAKLLGSMECYLSEIISTRRFKKQLKGLCDLNGTIAVSAEEAEELSVGDAEFHVRAEKLDRKELFGNPDPFLKIYRILDDNGRQLIYQSEYIKRTVNPMWRIFRINLQMLCGGDKKKAFVIECWDYSTTGRHEFIGECSISVNGIIARRLTPVPLINDSRQNMRLICCGGYENSGLLYFSHFQVVKRYSFLEFIRAGTQLDLSVAVDLTASNGDPRKKSSLHYIKDPSSPSPYELVIRAIADICQFYNRSRRYNAYGFGAIIPGQRKVSPVFNLVLQGLNGILDAYHSCVSAVRLYGPTNFAPVIKEAASASAEIGDGSRYQILLIITDGAVCDVSGTKRAIIEASYFPISIIIIGVGSEDFSSMKELTPDDALLTFDGGTANRDIVQFFALRDLVVDYKTNVGMAERMLAKLILPNITQQLTTYMELNGIVPMERADKPVSKYGEAYSFEVW